MRRSIVISLVTLLIFLIWSVSTKGQADSTRMRLNPRLPAIEMKLGFRENITDPRTRNYFDTYWNIPLGVGIYYRNFFGSFIFAATSVGTVKKDIPLPNGNVIKRYKDESKSDYWMNIITRNLMLGYEINLNQKWSISPYAGWLYGNVTVMDNSNRFNIASMRGNIYGLAISKYTVLEKRVLAFVSVNGSFNQHDLQDKIPALGNSFYNISITVGLRVQPKRRAVENYLLSQ